MSRGYRYHRSDQQPYQTLDDKWNNYEKYLEDLSRTVVEMKFDSFAVIEFNTQINQVPLDYLTDKFKRLFILPDAFDLIPDELLFEYPAIPKQIEVAEPPQLMLEKSAYPPIYFQPIKVGYTEDSPLFYKTKNKLGDVINALSNKHLNDPASNIQSETEKVSEIYAYEKQRRYRLELLEKVEVLREAIRCLNHDNAQKKKLAYEQYRALKNDASPEASKQAFEILHKKYPLPKFLRTSVTYHIDLPNKVCLIEFDFPDYTNQSLVMGFGRSRGYVDESKPKYAPQSTKRKLVKQCLCSLLLRYAFLASTSNLKTAFTHVAVNAIQTWFDPATGKQRTGVVGSVFASTEDLSTLDLSKLDPELSVRHLKGLLTPSFDSIQPVRPIFVLNKTDERFVEARAVDHDINESTNLASIDWEDFEHLVAQLLEWEFVKNGVEVRVTRASRDRGVDAILFDPDSLRGGKFVIQAKRYTKTVDVSAVRDLYGTVMNEGANRGILITTASYGPDAYEFVRDKPISLVDGQNLLLLLEKHGRKYRINLEEARALQRSNQ